MYYEIDIDTFLIKAKTIPVVDVRTPAEYQKGHIPGAFNIPLFNNQERKTVGITFKKQGRKHSIYKGLEFAGPKLGYYVKQASKLAKHNQLLVHCWRGGMRSSSMAWLFDVAGIVTYVLKGGYKSYRKYVLNSFNHPYHFVVIGGMTGSGKSAILQTLIHYGQQTIDLEQLAHHKGSAFGSLGEKKQNTNEQFENELSWELSELNSNLPAWIEDESRNIGYNLIPEGIFKQIREAHLLNIDMPKEQRIARLVNDYARFNKDLLGECINKISKRLGGLNTKMALDALQTGDYIKVVNLVLNYYDKTYQYSLSRRDHEKVHSIHMSNGSPVEMSAKIIEFAKLNKIIR